MFLWIIFDFKHKFGRRVLPANDVVFCVLFSHVDFFCSEDGKHTIVRVIPDVGMWVDEVVSQPSSSRAQGKINPTSDNTFPFSIVTFRVVFCMWMMKVSLKIQPLVLQWFRFEPVGSPVTLTTRVFQRQSSGLVN